MLGKMQRRATLWILGAFKMLPMLGIEAIAGLIPINLHLQKLGRRFQLKTHSLPSNHIICSLMEIIMNVHYHFHQFLNTHLCLYLSQNINVSLSKVML